MAAVLIGLALATGCSSSGSFIPPPPEPTTAPLPTGGVYLTELGFSYAPAAFSIPASAKMITGYNIPDLINVIFTGADGPAVHDYLMQNLAGMGFTVTASSNDSILWDNDVWAGAFTMTADQAGLTLRLKG